MSLSTLLEAAKYLDYLDSNNHQQQQQTQLHFQSQNAQQATKKPAARRQRSSKKNAADAMIAMSLPTSTRPIQTHGVPIPLVANNDNHLATSLSSSFTTGSPLSSFASTALFCSKASNVTSASSSAASSLSSSDSSSSCGEILMGDNEFNQSLTGVSTGSNGNKRNRSKMTHKNINNSNNNHHNYHLTHQQSETNHQYGNQQFNNSLGNNNQSIARYIAATSTGPQLVTMTTNTSMASTSAPIDSNIRAGHVIHAANSGAILSTTPGANFDARHFSLATSNGIRSNQQALGVHEGQTFSVIQGSFGSDNQLSGSPNSCPPLIMTRVQPMILNSLSPSAQGIMAFQPATASSPTSSSSSYSRHRELHKTLEKNRRAHLRYCFELLKSELPASECVDKKTSHINIIKSAIRYVLALRQQENEIDNELLRLTKIKGELTENLSKLRNNQTVTQQQQPITTSASTTTSEQQQPKQEQQLQQQHQPAAEQQLSFLLSQSKID